MNQPNLSLPCLLLLVAPLVRATAQGPDPLVTFRYPETTMSLSGGTVLQTIQPNEIAQVRYAGQPPCPIFNTCEKWSPRTCMQTMAGDENGDSQFWNPALFGEIDALCLPTSATGPAKHNPRSVFWSPSAAMGMNLSVQPLRPGDVGRIHSSGNVQHFMRQEQFNKALGLPLTTPIDVDAIAYQVGLGIYFSLDAGTWANTACGLMWVDDGDLIAIPASAITWGFDFRVVNVAANSAGVVRTEAQFDAMLVNSGVGDRFGAPIAQAIDLESLDIDQSSSAITMFTCGNWTVAVPDFLFSTESMTGCSLLTTIGGGTIPWGPCSPMAMPAPNASSGVPLGVQPVSWNQGAASFVNALAFATTNRFVLEPQQHQLNYGLAGGPGTTVAIGSDFPFVLTWIELVLPPLPGCITVAPMLSPNGFPDYYFPSNMLWNIQAVTNGFGTFATPTIPVGWSGKLLFQSAALNGSNFELSTPALIDVN